MSGRVLCRVGDTAGRAALSLGSPLSTRFARSATPGAAAARRALSVEADKKPGELTPNQIWLKRMVIQEASDSSRELYELHREILQMQRDFDNRVAAHRYAVSQATEAVNEKIWKGFVASVGGFMIGSLLIMDGR